MSDLFDALVSHQISLERAKAGEANKSLDIVKPIDERIILILKSLDDGFTRGQLNAALFQIKQLITSGYSASLFPHLERIGKTTTGFEIEFAHSIIAGFLTEEPAPKPVAADVYQTVQTRTYQGATMAAWANGLIDDKYNKVQSAVETAVNEGSNFIAPARSAIRNSNNNVKTITRSTVSHASNIARAETYELNDESVQVIVWSSILDGRTTITCGVRSNKMYNAKTKEPIEHDNEWGGGPGVIHFGCRSIGIPSNREGIIVAGSQKGKAIFTGSKTAIGARGRAYLTRTVGGHGRPPSSPHGCACGDPEE